MTEFKTGDRLRGTASGSGLPLGEVFEGEYRGDTYLDDGWVKVYGSGGGSWWLDPGLPITVVSPEPPKLAFVGPRPEPVKTPKVVLPFRAVGTVVKDDDGNRVTAFYGDLTSDTDDEELARLVVRLLNKHFGVE